MIGNGMVCGGMTREDVKESMKRSPDQIKFFEKDDYDELWVYKINFKITRELYFKNGILMFKDI